MIPCKFLRFNNLLFVLLVSLLSCKTRKHSFIPGPVYTNDRFIEGLYTNIKTDSPKAVFAYIFESLPESVTVYPSENVFYFKTPILGKTYDGTITLYPAERDSGKLGFGFVTRMEHRNVQKYFMRSGGAYDFTRSDGLEMEKINENTYDVQYEKKKIRFHLHVLPDTAPSKLLLNLNEEWVTSTFDESGLQFHILFNKKTNHLFWVLNEAAFVPESFHVISPNLVMGDRTEFVFYNDTSGKRKVLVGVNGENVMQNNWYDGPFDHLADNRVKAGKLNMKAYLEKHFPNYAGKIDQYGRFVNQYGSRVALAPYLVYFNLQDLSPIDSLCNTRKDNDQFFMDITRQHYNVPFSYYDIRAGYLQHNNQPLR